MTQDSAELDKRQNPPKQYKQRIADKAVRKDAVQDKSVGRANVPRKANEGSNAVPR